MTRNALLIVAIAAGVMLLPGLARTPAVAGVHWSVGTSFSVGGLDFNLVFGLPYGYLTEEIFYRTHQALHYGGYRCHGACSYRDGYYYHHRDCPLVRHHFRSYGYAPAVDWRMAPHPYDRGWRPYTGYRSYRDRSDRHRSDRHRYDRYRYDQYRRDGRRFRDNDWDSDSDTGRYDGHRREWDRGRSDRYDRGRRDGNRSRFDSDRDRRDSRRRGSDTRSPRRR